MGLSQKLYTICDKTCLRFTPFRQCFFPSLMEIEYIKFRILGPPGCNNRDVLCLGILFGIYCLKSKIWRFLVNVSFFYTLDKIYEIFSQKLVIWAFLSIITDSWLYVVISADIPQICSINDYLLAIL